MKVTVRYFGGDVECHVSFRSQRHLRERESTRQHGEQDDATRPVIERERHLLIVRGGVKDRAADGLRRGMKNVLILK